MPSATPTWVERGADERLLREVLLVDVVPGPCRCRRPAPTTCGSAAGTAISATFEATEWSAELQAMRARVPRALRRDQDAARRRATAASVARAPCRFSVGDDYTLVSPVTVFNFPEDHKTPPQIDILGFTLIRLDPQYVRGTLLPTLTARHFHGDDGTADYRVAVDRSERSGERDLGVGAGRGRGDWTEGRTSTPPSCHRGPIRCS